MTMLQGRGMRRCNWRVRSWHATAIDDILRDVDAVAVAGDLTNSVVPRDHVRGRIMSTTKYTTINHDDNVAREGNALVKRVVLFGGGLCRCRRRHCKGRCCHDRREGSGISLLTGIVRPWEGTNCRDKETQQPTMTMTLQ